MRRFKHTQGAQELRAWVKKRLVHFGPKFAWFFEKGYEPHLYQAVFHTLCSDALGTVLPFRCLVAGRRGGKTMSAAWEVTFYCLHPEVFHFDTHRRKSDRPLHVWVLVPDFRNSGRAAMRTLRTCFKQAGLVEGKDYKWNKGDLYIEFANDSLIEFKSAETAENLVGAGIDILWIDEAAVIPSITAYEYASPALDDKEGVVICTTTPRGKNWFYETFWGERAQKDDAIGSVEYRSIDNPYYPRERWIMRKQQFHPMKFMQEYMAAFDALSGKEFSAEWLTHFEDEELPLKTPELLSRREDGSWNIPNLNLDIFIGIDPAISMSARADHFAWAVLGVTKDREQAFLLEIEKTKIPFPEQVQLIQTLHMKWRPYFIGVEAQAYQAALVQQAMRLSSMPPIVAQQAREKKAERILAMAPIFRVGKVKIRNEQHVFIDQWVNYDPELKHPEDDCLDATEIALRTAGVLLPGFPDPEVPTNNYQTIDELAWLRAPKVKAPSYGYDEHMGMEW